MKHLADHPRITTGARVAQYLRLARDRSETAWARVWQRPTAPALMNRRAVEFARIERGRRV